MDRGLAKSPSLIRLYWRSTGRETPSPPRVVSIMAILTAAIIGGLFAMIGIKLLNHIAAAAYAGAPPTWLWCAPFVLLLAAIAWMPWKWPRMWDWVGFPASAGLALLVVLAYGWRLHTLVPVAASVSAYGQFMAVITALYVVCTNLQITLHCAPTPRNNLLVLLAAAVVANIIGTCGATLLFIGPFLTLNRHRLTESQIFLFVAIVANIGGLLTPLGDPPLMAGYLYGVPFDWMLIHAWPMWCAGLVWLGGIFYFLQRRIDRTINAPTDVMPPAVSIIKIENIWLLIPLAVILGALFLTPAYRVGLLAAVAIGVAGVYRSRRNVGPPAEMDDHAARPSMIGYRPLGEMASLFLGLFITMTPVLAMIGHLPPRAKKYIASPSAYFISVGAASSVLDNTPTYIAGLQSKIAAAHRSHKSSEAISMPSKEVAAMATAPKDALYLLAIALGAVMFGAMTWIGNGPNLLVEMICRNQGIKCPTFGRYIWRYSIPILLPLLAAVAAWLWWFSGR